MADRQLREFERAAARGGPGADEALARMRERTRVSACCGRPHRNPAWRCMTPEEVTMAQHLGRCTFPVASFDKRFAADVASLAANLREITHKQAALLRVKVQRYRRQIPPSVVLLAGPPA